MVIDKVHKAPTLATDVALLSSAFALIIPLPYTLGGEREALRAGLGNIS
jgi:hypothetical protein